MRLPVPLRQIMAGLEKIAKLQSLPAVIARRVQPHLSLRGAQRRGNPVEATAAVSATRLPNPRIEYGGAMTSFAIFAAWPKIPRHHRNYDLMCLKRDHPVSAGITRAARISTRALVTMFAGTFRQGGKHRGCKERLRHHGGVHRRRPRTWTPNSTPGTTRSMCPNG